MSKPVMMDLFCVIDSSLSSEPGFCKTGFESGRPNYLHWETNVATPALVKAGFLGVEWHDGESDSFGPLTRYCVCYKDGDQFRFMYG